ncbi:MAG: alpha/beta hydrolase domain-containing protein [Nocardioides sp.]
MVRLRLVAPLLVLALTATGLAVGSPAVARPEPATSVPRLSNPPAGIMGHPLWDSYHQLAPFGYEEQEYFVSGVASTLKGKTARYRTRVIVFRPKSEKLFNGTVLLDWVNVTAQFENPVDSLEAREFLLREGYAFVHVSAQAAGVCCIPLTPQGWDPVRYASLNHPGDDYAQDMFTQIARALRGEGTGVDPMPGLAVRRVLAAGQSQSASRLYDYVNENQRAGGAIDGFLIHGGGEKTFEERLTVPVMHLLSDREADPTPPSNDPNYRLMEIAGTGHSDYFIGYQQVFGASLRVASLPALDKQGFRALIEQAGNYGQLPSPLHPVCIVAGSTMPMHYATSTALHQLDRWVRTGRAPKKTPRYRFAGGALAKDSDRNALGGIRLPPVEVPVATYESNLCQLGGLTIPFTELQLIQRYGTYAAYRKKMTAATDTAVRRGWLLRVDARDQMRRVCSIRVRFNPLDTGKCESYTPPPFGG